MDTFVILRRGGWATADDVGAAGKRSSTALSKMDGEVRWLRSYFLTEPNGRLGSVCIYQATDAEAVRRHAQAADLPVDEIVPVADLVVVETDPA
jgi:Protein of unknown function (DUF4242)